MCSKHIFDIVNDRILSRMIKCHLGLAGYLCPSGTVPEHQAGQELLGCEGTGKHQPGPTGHSQEPRG